MPDLTDNTMQTHVIKGNETGFRQLLTEKAFFLLACLLCGLPVWIPHFPPMADLPQHAAQVSLFLNLGRPDFPFSDQFETHLFTPYLIGYGLIAAITPLLGIVAASKLVISLALAGFAFSTRLLLRQAGADYYWSWLTFPALYGFTYQWGLLNFLVAAPVGILFLGLVWRQKAQPDLPSSLLNTLVLYALFFCHALILGLFSLIAVSYWLLSAPRPRDFIKCAWPMFALAPLVLTWLVITSKHPSTHLIQWDLSWSNTTNGYYTYLSSLSNEQEPGWGRITGFIPRLLGAKPELAITLLGITLFALPFLAGGRINTSRARLIPMLVITLVLLFLPSFLFGNAFTFQRFTFLAMPLFLLMIDAPARTGRLQRRLRLLAPLIALGWIGYMTIHALRFDKEAEGFETILTHMEPGKRSLSPVFTHDDSDSIAPTFLHFPAWYSALKSGVTDPSFAKFIVQPVAYKPEYILKANFDGFPWNPQMFNWNMHQGHKYDYFVVRAPFEAGKILFKDATCNIELVSRAGQWWLYRRDPNC